MRKTLCSDGITIRHSIGPWDVVRKYSNVLCEDGKTRTIVVGEPDTFFSVPGRTQERGKTVTGFVSYDPDKEREVFTACGKNASAITDHAV